jgi:2-polyprenyl-3-methyl-5-hydroxy-6-metoxy-1,4-benzoquinol methylase
MNRKEIIEGIVSKKDFSKIPEDDILLTYGKFERRECSEEEKIRLTRDLLRKVYSAFTSGKLLNIKEKGEEWLLRKHLSTRERLNYYGELYEKLFKGMKKCSVIDLGSGINGLSYKFFPKKVSVNYTGVEAVGQLVDLMNFYFEKNNLNARAMHESLFNIKNIKKLIEDCEKPRIAFLFKVIDSLEMIERDYSKKLLKEITPLCDKIIVSFATRSMIRQDKFKVNRKWIINFIDENFILLEDFEIGNERYIIFKQSKNKV